MLFADEIYDRILYDDAEHVVTAAIAPEVLCVTMSGLSKSSRVAGFRSGWAVVSGPREQARSYLEGLTVLANMRLCPNVPAQHAIAVALESPETIAALVLPGGRLLEQRNRTWELLNAIPGVSCVKPLGALYAFPRIDPAVLPIANDEQMALDVLRAETDPDRPRLGVQHLHDRPLPVGDAADGRRPRRRDHPHGPLLRELLAVALRRSCA